MIWLVFGMFYLLLVLFILGAFALSRRADDQIRIDEKRLAQNDEPCIKKDSIKIRHLVQTTGNKDATPLCMKSNELDKERLAS